MLHKSRHGPNPDCREAKQQEGLSCAKNLLVISELTFIGISCANKIEKGTYVLF